MQPPPFVFVSSPRWTEDEELQHRAYWDRLLSYWEHRAAPPADILKAS
jgi:hypothetical protein